MWGLVHLGSGELPEAVACLLTSLRACDHGGQLGLFEGAAVALAAALAESGHPLLAARLDGYATAHPVGMSMRDPSNEWLRARLTRALSTLEPGQLAATVQTGAGLNRRGYLSLLKETEMVASGDAS
jgi:hypothetical protein